MEPIEVTMEGGKPWGIRMQGGAGTGAHLRIGQVTPASKAEQAGVKEGLHILSINGNDTTAMSMAEAQDIVKGTGDKLTIQLVEKASCPADEEEDFLEDLKKSMGTQDPVVGGGRQGGTVGSVKSNTFRMIQEHIDAGQGGRVLSAFDKPREDRNQSVAINAPRIHAQDEGYDKTLFGLDDDVNTRQTAYIIRMTGGRPWGFRLQGGQGTGNPLCVASVTPDSKAHTARLLVGDEIVRINDTDTRQLSMQEAQEVIKCTGNDLKITLIKHGLKNIEQCGPTTAEDETLEQRNDREEDEIYTPRLKFIGRENVRNHIDFNAR